jgi:PadR family transcriptional regulator, regulatory protein PadR
MSEKDEIISGLLLELRRGTIVLGVLCQLATSKYGYSLVQQLGENDVAVEANTLYPLLRRLEKQGLLRSEWETSGTKPRKYYITTPLGIEVYTTLKQEWLQMVEKMNKLMNKEQEDGGKRNV